MSSPQHFSKKTLKYMPLGGVGQIGSNISLFHDEEDGFLIDAGILFPMEDVFEINYLIPDLSELPVTPTKLFITHGHEDHIGAIVHVLKQFPDIELHAPAFAAALIEFKLKSFSLNHKIFLFDQTATLHWKEYNIHPIHVNHSIPETFGLLINSPNLEQSYFFVSDFKVDFHSPFEEPFNFQKLTSLSKNSSQRVLFCDSTNITSKQEKTLSEGDLTVDIDKILSQEGRVFATFFASNIHRLQTFLKIAKKTDRQVLLYGGSLLKYAEVAARLGIIDSSVNYATDPKQIKADATKLLVLCTGCQGDFRGSFRRVCSGQDTYFKLGPDDHVVVSSKAIPGNEKKLAQIFNEIVLTGASLYTPDRYTIHASGHPGLQDIRTLIEKFNPTDIVPIHGESLFLAEHQRFIEQNYPLLRSHLLKNFDILDLSSGQLSIGISRDPILIHGNGISIERTKISERRKLASLGALFISYRIGREVLISISYSGLPDTVERLNEEFEGYIKEIIKQSKPAETSEQVRIKARQFFGHHLGYRPICFVHAL